MNTNDTEIKVIETRAPDFKEVYSNSSKMRITPWDIALMFGQQKMLPNGEASSEDEVAVVMSPQHFKVLVSAINNTLVAYESQFGAINVPSEFFPTIGIPDGMASNKTEPKTKKS